MIEKTFDQIILERLKRSAAGLSHSDGRPVSQLDQLLAQGALTSRAVRAFGGCSLFSVVQGLLTEAMFDAHRADLFSWNMWRPGGAAETYFATVMNAISSGRLIVREPLNFLRCNDLPEIQMLANLCEGFASMAILVRYAVKQSEAVSWLEEQGLDVPEWLSSRTTGQGDCEKWSSNFDARKARLRQQVDIIQAEIEAKGWLPLALPSGYKVELGEICRADYPELFNDSSCETALDALRGENLIRYIDHRSVSRKRSVA